MSLAGEAGMWVCMCEAPIRVVRPGTPLPFLTVCGQNEQNNTCHIMH